jgi:hypothetical protein
VSAPKPRVTFSYPAEWDRPQANAGTGVVTRIVACPRCGGLRYAGTGPHAPRWVGAELVDCVGARVEVAR